VARRSYGQACTLARTLDVVGERWTLLLVRELMLGPKRFTDLLAGVPGMGRNLLAERLRRLEAEGLVRRGQLPPPAASRVYELTGTGRALGPALAELGRWGAERLPPAPPTAYFRPAWAVFPLTYMADIEATSGVHETYEFRIEGERFHVRVDDGTIEPRAGGAPDPDLVITMSSDTLRELFLGDLGATEALTGGLVEVDGAPEALQNALAILASGG
jgi:DNA-binding HxlR family transcriptional regulator